MDELEALVTAVIDCAFHIHHDVGPGLLESVYETVLAKRLSALGFKVEKQKPIAIEIDGIAFGDAFRADLIVNGILLLEIKSVENLAPVHINRDILDACDIAFGANVIVTRVRTHSQNITIAARAQADRKISARRSKRMAILRQSFMRPNVFSIL